MVKGQKNEQQNNFLSPKSQCNYKWSSENRTFESSLQNRRYFFAFLSRGEHEVRDTPLPSRVSRTLCSPRDCPRSPEKRKKRTPVLQAILKGAGLLSYSETYGSECTSGFRELLFCQTFLLSCLSSYGCLL